MFCSWDAEEFGLIGSTEWVEVKNLIIAFYCEFFMILCDILTETVLGVSIKRGGPLACSP